MTMTRWLNWSAMTVSPPEMRTAFVGNGVALLDAERFVKYSKTTFFWAVTSTMRLCPASVIRVSPFGRRLAKAAVVSPLEYCQRIEPALLISITRLLFSSAMRMWPLARSSAEFGLLRAPGPEEGPYDHITW